MSKEQYIALPEEYTRRELNARYREIPLKDTTSRLLRKYFNAMANLYGIIPLHKAKEIIFSLSPKLVTEDEFLAFAEIARHECEGYYILGGDELYTHDAASFLHPAGCVCTAAYEDIERIKHHEKETCSVFFASGVTAKVAETLAEAIGADIFEIEPKVPYTEADLDWMDKKARSTIEMSDPASRPEIAVKRDNMKDYDTIFVGFPIWWYVAPTIINTFLESYDLTGKTIIPFATSGGSDIGKTNERLAPSCKGAKLMDGKAFKGNIGHQELAAWVEGLGL